MDFLETIQQLRIEKEKIERVIAELEQLESGDGHDFTKPDVTRPKRRGRKSMGLEERKQVAARMKRYWANRRRLAVSERAAGA